MKINNNLILVVVCLPFGIYSNAQEAEINGKVIAENEDDVEWIHVINKTANKFTITDTKGNFNIPAKLNDTIIISSIKYMREEIIIDNIIMHAKLMKVYLKENINQLNEVIVGKFLTGDLRSDILNTKIKDEINFYDVGIPGYIGKLKTQNERKLYEADSGKFIYFYGVGFAINVHKILNRISGRTKKMKLHVRLEKLDACMNKVISDFSESIFGSLEIEEQLKTDFFYFVSEDPNFLNLCKLENNMDMYEFLVDKLFNYKDNFNESKD